MSAGARRGASPAVVRAIEGHAAAHIARASESAACPLCRGTLRFTTGHLGQTLERCDTRRCPNAIPHHPQPDPNASEPRCKVPKKRTGNAKGRPVTRQTGWEKP